MEDSVSSYRDRVKALLGDADPLDVQAELLAALEQAVAGLSAADLSRPERPGKWSILEVVEHLVDAEIAHAYRLRMTLEHDSLLLHAHDRDLWARKGACGEADLTDSLSLLRLLRARNLALLRRLGDADLSRAAHHGRRGPEDLRHMIALTAGHDLIHRRQIDRIKRTHGL